MSFVGILGYLKKAAAYMRCSERNPYSEVNTHFLSRSVTIITLSNVQTVVDVLDSKFMAPKVI